MNSRFRPYRIILSRQGGSINIIQVTVYFFTVPALKLMNVKFCLFLATTAHCHDRAAIKIHITTFNCINLQVRCGNLHNFNCFWLSIYIYTNFLHSIKNFRALLYLLWTQCHAKNRYFVSWFRPAATGETLLLTKR